jgi:outer membrane protein assembly factor BamA
MLDYYGAGPDSDKSGRTSYRLEDTGIDGSGRYRVWSHLYVGASGGVYLPNVGRGRREGIPSTDEMYTPAQVPGLNEQPKFFRAGGMLEYDYRDLATGPREGGHYYAKHLRYWDRESDRHTFHLLDSAIEQYIPYWNKTRVVALRLGTVMTWAGEGNAIPFYLQPTLGGNEFLRGFARYRFYDQNSFHAVAEHRWYVSANAHGALFFEMGKVTRKASELNFHNLEYAGGAGLRFTARNAVIMRIEAAISREGVRAMWTFSNMW